MNLSDFDYALPKELIALRPAKERAAARLFAVDRKTGEWRHQIFRDLPNFLSAGDVLVLNDTKVIPARLFARKPTGGQVEAFLTKRISERRWNALIRPGRRVRGGMTIYFNRDGVTLQATVLDESTADSGERVLEFAQGTTFDQIKAVGHVPLPPYINRPDEPGDRENYQTVFAREEGAVASPTAGLHFDQGLLDKLRTLGVEIVTVTLHVGYGTFQTILTEDLSKHRMHEEEFEVTEAAAESVNRAKTENRRIIACGTTVVRALETCADESGRVAARRGATRLFITPPYRFKVPSGMITNFHLPKSSLLLLVGAFLGWDKTLSAYREAIRRRYHFYSYGDAMLIV
ncbi:MAG: tRNA preQ1(34) S-adenosylmethionine ribosyltransferase-isomerase QueA [Candidatus Omnitrophota bacterium]|jgi:S-adenosylmethionine:tRNA ribosyltransferase-isomerase